MSITDELRKVAAKTECANGRCEKLYRGDLDHIADRIDEELANYIELPKDADGKTIHLGDEVEWLEGNRLTVNGIGEGGTLFYVDAQGDIQWTASGNKRHVKPDSWERIIEDAQADGVRYHNEGKPSDFDALVERCKRLAGEGA